MDWIELGLEKWTLAQLWFHSCKEVTFVYFDSEYLPAKVRGGGEFVRPSVRKGNAIDVFGRRCFLSQIKSRRPCVSALFDRMSRSFSLSVAASREFVRTSRCFAVHPCARGAL